MKRYSGWSYWPTLPSFRADKLKDLIDGDSRAYRDLYGGAAHVASDDENYKLPITNYKWLTWFPIPTK